MITVKRTVKEIEAYLPDTETQKSIVFTDRKSPFDNHTLNFERRKPFFKHIYVIR